MPAAHLWGAQTQRSIEIPIGVDRYRWDRPVIRAFRRPQSAPRGRDAALGELPADKAALIERGMRRTIDGRLDAEFPLVVVPDGLWHADPT